jgi:hypothetical protein
MVRIRSEHAIGFLKGQFSSLKDLRINIRNERSHKFATYWVASCVGLHAFAMQCKSEEVLDPDCIFRDPFINEGLSLSSSDSDNNRDRGTAAIQRQSGCLKEARKHREKLKRRLFRVKGLELS